MSLAAATLALWAALPAAAGATSPHAAPEADRRALLAAELAGAPYSVAAERIASGPLPFGGRPKADVTGPWDLEHLRIELAVPDRGPPGEGVFELLVRPVGELAPLSLLALHYTPLGITDARTGMPVPFAFNAVSSELVIHAEQGAPLGEQSVALVLHAALDIPCDDAAHCLAEGDARHLVQFGWYPVAYDHPLEDRFFITLDLTGGWTFCPAGEPLAGTDAAPQGEATFPGPSTLPGFAWGDLRTAVSDLSPPVWTCSLAGEGGGASRMSAVASAARDHHADLLGGPAFPRLAVAEIGEAAGVGLSPMELVLLPSPLWTRDDAVADDLRDAVVSHEVAHQHFYNRVGIAAPADAWLSEGIAEYLSCRFQRARSAGHREDAFRLNYWGYVLGTPVEVDAPLWSEEALGSPAAFEILYQKGSAVLRGLEAELGADAMAGFLAELVDRFGGEILTTEAFLATLQDRAGAPVAAALAERLADAAVSVLEVTATPGHGARDPARLRFGVRPRPGAPENTEVHFMNENGIFDVVFVHPDGDAAPLEVPAAVQWVRIDPDLKTFRRVKPQPAADVNLTGVVDGMDFLDVAAAQGLAVPSPDWDDRLDVTGDGAVDAADLESIGAQLGAGW